jgi:hypothetical protein
LLLLFVASVCASAAPIAASSAAAAAVAVNFFWDVRMLFLRLVAWGSGLRRVVTAEVRAP